MRHVGELAMFELLLVACVNFTVCEYIASPLAYETREACAQQAALIAGTVRGRHDAGGELTYRYDCRPVVSAALAAPPGGQGG
jgi:ssDNA-binding Zn-finger/Zn-ribbon topoisomerase 1